jgi:photosystem II stability/assembly factor-like uncharacterized protein
VKQNEAKESLQLDDLPDLASLPFILELGCSGIMPSRGAPSRPTQSPMNPSQQDPTTVQASADPLDGKIRKISVLPVDKEHCPYDFQFVTDHIGWLFCTDRIWQTTDGGYIWEQIAVNNVGSDYASFFFSNSQVGWCYSYKMIQQTEDGGHHWDRIPNPIKAERGAIKTVRFLKDGKTGWLAGSEWEPIPSGADAYDFPHPSRTDGKNAVRGIIFHTTDGGHHWQKQNAPIRLGYLVDYFYVSESNDIWALCDFDLLHLVGNDWKKVDFKKSNCMNSQLLNALNLTEDAEDYFELTEINFSDAKNGWLSVANSLVAKSTDGGQTWCDLLSPHSLREQPNEPTAFKELFFADSRKGWGLTRSGKLYRTYDGGASWEKIQSDLKFSSMHFLNPQNGWLIAGAIVSQVVRTLSR